MVVAMVRSRGGATAAGSGGRALTQTQVPTPSHFWVPLQEGLSVQEIPATTGELITPSLGSQTTMRQGLLLVIGTGLLPTHLPPVQASVWVQTLLSSQAVPSACAWPEQAPVFGSHTPTWHCAGAGHMTGLLPVQIPEAQASV